MCLFKVGVTGSSAGAIRCPPWPATASRSSTCVTPGGAHPYRSSIDDAGKDRDQGTNEKGARVDAHS